MDVDRCTPPHRHSFALWLISVVALLLFVLVDSAGSASGRNLDTFAKCLAGKNAVMYGSFWCSHCDDQKAMFGPSFKYVRYIECATAGSRQINFSCKVAQIRYTPTWILNNKEILVGVQPLKTLAGKTGCSLP